MARKTLTWTGTNGRDKGRTFLITEMSARAGHEWATRFLLGLMNAGADIPSDVLDRGMAGLALVAAIALPNIGKLPPEIALALMGELMACVQSVQEKAVRSLVEDDIEEIATIFQLQREAFVLHTGGFTSGDPSTSESTKEAVIAG